MCRHRGNVRVTFFMSVLHVCTIISSFAIKVYLETFLACRFVSNLLLNIQFSLIHLSPAGLSAKILFLPAGAPVLITTVYF